MPGCPELLRLTQEKTKALLEVVRLYIFPASIAEQTFQDAPIGCMECYLADYSRLVFCATCKDPYCLAHFAEHCNDATKHTEFVFGVNRLTGVLYCEHCKDIHFPEPFDSERETLERRYRKSLPTFRFSNAGASVDLNDDEVEENAADGDADADADGDGYGYGDEDDAILSSLLHEPQSPDVTVLRSDILLGFTNLGHTCYANATLQFLIHCRPIVSVLKRHSGCTPKSSKPECLACELRLLVSEYYEPPVIQHVNAYRILYLLRSLYPEFNTFSQQDAHEFFSKVLETLHTQTGNVRRESSTEASVSSPEQESAPTCLCITDRFFGGSFHTSRMCTHCQHTWSRSEPFYDIPLPLNTETSNLENCLAEALQPEEHVSNCEACDTERLIRTTRSIRQAPEVLLLNLQRFERRPRNGKLVKNKQRVEFAEQLDISTFLAPPEVLTTAHKATLERGVLLPKRTPNRKRPFALISQADNFDRVFGGSVEVERLRLDSMQFEGATGDASVSFATAFHRPLSIPQLDGECFDNRENLENFASNKANDDVNVDDRQGSKWFSPQNSPTPPPTLTLPQPPLPPPSCCYRLRAVIYHRGTIHNGHYISRVWNDINEEPGFWMECDDGRVERVNLNDPLTNFDPYMFLYVKS